MQSKNSYEKAYQIAIEALSQRDLEEVAFNSSVQLEPALPFPTERKGSRRDGAGRGESLIVPALGQIYRVEEQGRKITQVSNNSDPQIAEKIILLHYLITADGTPLSGEALSFENIPGAGFYYPTFKKRTIDQLVSAFQNDLARFIKISLRFGGRLREEDSDNINPSKAHIKFFVLPNVSISFIYWRGEEELPPTCQILYDASVTHYLPLEDIVVITEMLTHRLIRSKTIL